MLLKIGFSFFDYLFIGAKFLSSEHPLEVWEQEKVTRGQPDLENTVDAEAIRSPILAILRCCFWSIVSSRGTHFEQSFLISKYSQPRYDQHVPLISLGSQLSQSTSHYGFVDFFDVFVGNSSLFGASTACIVLGAHLSNHFSTVDFAGAKSE